jgi:hypothetical protein
MLRAYVYDKYIKWRFNWKMLIEGCAQIFTGGQSTDLVISVEFRDQFNIKCKTFGTIWYSRFMKKWNLNCCERLNFFTPEFQNQSN